METIANKLTIELANISDLTELQKIEQECDAYFLFDPPCEDNHSCTIQECLMKGDLPAGGKKENYYFCNIRQNDSIIGFLAYYLGYEQPDTAYLSVLYVQEQFRKHGIGSEILKILEQMLKTSCIKHILLHVSLRNAVALCFWVKHGYNHILEVECTGNLYPENFGGIKLFKTISS